MIVMGNTVFARPHRTAARIEIADQQAEHRAKAGAAYRDPRTAAGQA